MLKLELLTSNLGTAFIRSIATKLLFNTKKLVIFCRTV